VHSTAALNTYNIVLLHSVHMFRCSSRPRPPHNVPVLATSSTTECTGVRHVIHHVLYRFIRVVSGQALFIVARAVKGKKKNKE
jgi:hypothetical protein